MVGSTSQMDRPQHSGHHGMFRVLADHHHSRSQDVCPISEMLPGYWSPKSSPSTCNMIFSFSRPDRKKKRKLTAAIPDIHTSAEELPRRHAGKVDARAGTLHCSVHRPPFWRGHERSRRRVTCRHESLTADPLGIALP